MADEEIDFTKEWTHSDIAFVLEERRIYANKTILSMWSPVLSAMFNNDFKERGAAEIILPGKPFEDFVELMRVVHPPNKDVDGSNVCQLLPLTQEYQMTRVTSRCQKYLLSQPPTVKSLVLAETYHLGTLLKTCIQFAKKTPFATLQHQADFDRVEPSTLVNILNYKVDRLEAPMLAIKTVAAQKNPNQNRWCPGSDSRDAQDRHDLGARKGCLHCNSYNFEQIEKICSSSSL